ncbi:MAG: 4-(cytidine 5'-diphospho)-2-C-methyl-D-erythritol kinase [Thermosulfidibacteraceae bacterium]|jgi:4-diphosphocytidyl-2-C-methyl-D-erythritol kinase
MIQEKAYGKVNLHLQVVGKRKDGYHLLETLFSKINIHDTIYVEFIRGGNIELMVEGERIRKEKNLAYIAAKWYLARYKIKNWGASIVIKKNIPQGSGLGGGSSNAASVIRTFIRFFKESDPNLIRDSAEIGADIPFLLSNYNTAIGRGVGEILEGLDIRKSSDYKLIIVYPNISTSTKEVFDKFDELDRTIKKRTPIKIEIIRETATEFDIEKMKTNFFNHLESACFNLYPEIGEIKKKLLKLTKGYVFLTGSGSSLCILTHKDEDVKLDEFSGLKIYNAEFLQTP